MTLIPLQTKETAPAQAKPILERYEKNLGMIPNLIHSFFRPERKLSAATSPMLKFTSSTVGTSRWSRTSTKLR